MLKRLVAITAAATIASAGLGGVSSADAARSLPHVASGHRPGPAVLYAKPARSPQLANHGPWHAKPILVSGTSAYRDGEWMYQDYLYDDHGALGTPDPTTPYPTVDFLFSPPAGTFTYPTDPAYANNAADLVEFRTKPLAHSTAFRVTLNSLHKPSLVGFTIRLGASPHDREWPFGAGVKSPAADFLTVHGRHGVLTDAATGRRVGPRPRVRVSTKRRQFDIRLPHAAWNPHQRTVRMSIGVGLWDATTGHYLKPVIGEATTTRPGGAAATHVALVNVGPRSDELWPDVKQATVTIGDTAAGGILQSAMWREHRQAAKLALGAVQTFSSPVSFKKLVHHVTDNSRVPRTGPMDRIMVSHYPARQGLDPSQVCTEIAPSVAVGAKCKGRMGGDLQPYAIYVPKGHAPKHGYGLTLLLHSLSANYNQFATSHNQSELGDRGRGSIVVTPSGRGPDGGYAGIPEADTFETWNAVAHLYKLDPKLVDVSGYSMGGFGTYRLASRWPDLFARAFSVVGAPSPTRDLPSMRNVPLLAWNATADELVNLDTTIAAVQALTADGIRFTEDIFDAADHLTLATNDEYGPGARFLGAHRVNRNPMHVTFVVDPPQDSKPADVVANHAYWLSGISRRTTGSVGTIDVRSEGFGYGDPTPKGTAAGSGTLTGGSKPVMPFTEIRQTFTARPSTPKRNRLDITAKNIRMVTVDVARAKVTCHAKLHVVTDGQVAIHLLGCGRTIHAR